MLHDVVDFDSEGSEGGLVVVAGGVLDLGLQPAGVLDFGDGVRRGESVIQGLAWVGEAFGVLERELNC